MVFFFFSSRRRHTRWPRDWSSDVCSSDLRPATAAESQVVDLNPGPFEVYPYGVLQREVAGRDHLVPELRGELRGELRRHLVAAAADGRPYIDLHAAPSETVRRLPRDAREGAAPARVHHPDLSFADERDGNAIGHSHRETDARFGSHERVGLTGEAWLRHANHSVPRDLTDPRRRPQIHRAPDHGEVLIDRLGVVTDLLGDVQRVVWGFRSAAQTGEEEDPGSFGRRVRCDVDGAPSRGVHCGGGTVCGLGIGPAHASAQAYLRLRKAGMSRTSPVSCEAAAGSSCCSGSGAGRSDLRWLARRWSKPVAITVTLTLSPLFSSITAPKIRFASWCAALWTISAASVTSKSPRSGPPVIFSMIPVAPSMLASSSGLEIAVFAAAVPLVSLLDSPMPMRAEPESCMIVRTSAKSRLMRPGTVMRSVIPWTPFLRMSSAIMNASIMLVRFSATCKSLSLGMMMRESTFSFRRLIPSSAYVDRLRPSKAKGRVTTPTVSAPESLAILATTGAAPVPVPPPLPAVTKTMSAPRIASSISALFSSAASIPIFGSAPAPRPRVIFSPM